MFFAAQQQPLRTLASASQKHFKTKIVDNVAVITIDSPGVKVNRFTHYWFI